VGCVCRPEAAWVECLLAHSLVACTRWLTLQAASTATSVAPGLASCRSLLRLAFSWSAHSAARSYERSMASLAMSAQAVRTLSFYVAFEFDFE
jgi:hypothetical protein